MPPRFVQKNFIPEPLNESGCAHNRYVHGASYNDRRKTLFTSNYLDERSGREGETLDVRIGVRLRSRRYQMCRTVVIDFDDLRRRFDRGYV
jgi:hypothetical protein